MKFFLAIALIATVASAAIIKPNADVAEIQEIIAAIHSPSTDPATAAALEEMLLDVLGISPEPIAVGPALIEAVPEPVVVPSPVIVPSPAPVVSPSPVSIVEGPAAEVSTGSAPLVQIILNINQAAAESSPIAVAPVVVPEPIQPTPVQVVEVAPESVNVVETPVEVHPIGVVTPVQPIQVVETAPVQVIETAPVAVEPVIIGTPIIPEAAVVLPEELN